MVVVAWRQMDSVGSGMVVAEVVLACRSSSRGVAVGGGLAL